jgi:hypothetical protein
LSVGECSVVEFESRNGTVFPVLALVVSGKNVKLTVLVIDWRRIIGSRTSSAAIAQKRTGAGVNRRFGPKFCSRPHAVFALLAGQDNAAYDWRPSRPVALRYRRSTGKEILSLKEYQQVCVELVFVRVCDAVGCSRVDL